MTARHSLISALCPLAIVLLFSGPYPAFAADVTATLIRTIKTYNFNPPSPDPSDITYLSFDDTLLECDAEVDEMAIYQGANLFEMTRAGTLLSTYTTASTYAYPNLKAFSNEPAGCVFNPDNGHLFISDDNTKTVHDINPGSDRTLFTKDDTRTSFSTLTVCGSNDPEGIAYGQGALFISDGISDEIYKIVTNDGNFNGDKGESCTHFDTALLGTTDPEGIAYDPDHVGYLYVVGRPANQIAHLKLNATGGADLVRTIDISAANPKNPAGLAAVSKLKTSNGKTHIFVADRRVDNATNPAENDGKIYQFSLPNLSITGITSLVHQWKFNETSGTTALDSVGSNNASLSNVSWVVGKTGNAVSFNGINSSGTAGNIDFGTSNFTVTHWVKVTGYKAYAGIMCNRSSASGNTGFLTRTDGTSAITALIDFGTTSKKLSKTNLLTGTWYLVAVTVDRAGLMKLYINGVMTGQVDISTFKTTSLSNPNSVRFGRDQSSNYFNGVMDDLRVYSRALSASEILNIYNQ